MVHSSLGRGLLRVIRINKRFIQYLLASEVTFYLKKIAFNTELYEPLSYRSCSGKPEVLRAAERLLEAFFAGKVRVHRGKYLLPARKLVSAIWGHHMDEFRFPTGNDRFDGDKRSQAWHTQPVKTLFKFMRDEMNPPWVLKILNHVAPCAVRSKGGVGKTAVYKRTDVFKEVLIDCQASDAELPIDPPALAPEHRKRIAYKSKTGKRRSVPVRYKKSSARKHTEAVLEVHFDLLREASIWGVDGLEMDPDQYLYVRMFKGGTDVTGRFYAPFVNLPKKERLGIHFYRPEDANETIPVSIDLTALHPMMLMRINPERTNYDALYDLHGSRDIYDIDGFEHLDRAVHKTLFMAIINTKGPEDSIHRALAGCEYWIDGDEVKARLRGRRAWKYEKAFPDDKEGAKRYLGAYKKRHPDLVPYIGSGMGVKLQKMDSDMMLETLRLATEAGIPLLPVHDEVICPIDRADELKGILAKSFKTVMGDDYADYGSIPVKAKLPPKYGRGRDVKKFQILINL
jgi:hypothetical protein